MKKINKEVLLLNKSWIAISTIALKRAIKLLYSQYDDGMYKAHIINSRYQSFNWEQWNATEYPEIIQLTRYDKIPPQRIKFSRLNIYIRDNFTCQYCNKKLTNRTASLEHIIPVCRNGLTNWENCICACITCNTRKADKMLEDTDMHLISIPKIPKHTFLSYKNNHPKSWHNFL